MAAEPSANRRERAILTAARLDARRQIEAHEAQYHGVPSPRQRPLEAVMFPDETIPDRVLARMCEAIELEQLTLEEIAERWNLPPSLVTRELLAYTRLHQQWMLANALAAGR